MKYSFILIFILVLSCWSKEPPFLLLLPVVSIVPDCPSEVVEEFEKDLREQLLESNMRISLKKDVEDLLMRWEVDLARPVSEQIYRMLHEQYQISGSVTVHITEYCSLDAKHKERGHLISHQYQLSGIVQIRQGPDAQMKALETFSLQWNPPFLSALEIIREIQPRPQHSQSMQAVQKLQEEIRLKVLPVIQNNL